MKIRKSEIQKNVIFGGILMGLGLSLVFKGEGSTGGSDLLAQIIYKKSRKNPCA